jgi:hypothetical protein
MLQSREAETATLMGKETVLYLALSKLSHSELITK